MNSQIQKYQAKVLKTLSGRIDDFYLVGGTALSLYYFHHRDSLDLDFFTHNFDKMRVRQIIKLLSDQLKKRIELRNEFIKKDRAKVMIYALQINKKEALKIDFVQDYVDLIKPPKIINGIKVLSLEDIYLRKVYAIAGTYTVEDIIGRKVSKGGRHEAKDFYDLYCLSHIFMRLSDFAFRYCAPVTLEAIIRWFRTYDRFYMKTELLELKLKKDIDYKDMERHFKKEIDKILEKEVEFA